MFPRSWWLCIVVLFDMPNELTCGMCLQTELAQLQQDQQKLSIEKPLPIGRLKVVEGSIAELSAAMEQQKCQLSDFQQVCVRGTVSMLWLPLLPHCR